MFFIFMPSPTLLSRLILGGLLAALAAANPAVASTVTLKHGEDGRWQLLRDGRPCVVRAVAGFQHLDLAAELGANTIRTWGIDMLEAEENGRSFLERADALGFSILAGLWLEHEGPGISYDDPAFLQAQREKVRAAVRKYRDHPALLAWGLGNEVEHGVRAGDQPRIWRELEILARLVKEEDPHHPIVTAIAGAGVDKIRAMREHCPSIDIIGINAYGAAALVAEALDDGGWTGPFMLTEFGPRGPWESPKTPWGAALEPGMDEKIATYVGAHRAALADPRGRCLGTFCFIWGQKQEATATWFGMFLATGEKTPVVDAMAHEFTGRWPAHRSPQIHSFTVPFGLDRVPAGTEYPVAAEIREAAGQPLTYEWLVVAETPEWRDKGGAREKILPTYPACTLSAEGGRAVIRTPAQPGAYRLFLYVRDGHGGGTTQNIPFWVK